MMVRYARWRSLAFVLPLVRLLGAGYEVRLFVSHIETKSIAFVRGVRYHSLTVM